MPNFPGTMTVEWRNAEAVRLQPHVQAMLYPTGVPAIDDFRTGTEGVVLRAHLADGTERTVRVVSRNGSAVFPRVIGFDMASLLWKYRPLRITGQRTRRTDNPENVDPATYAAYVTQQWNNYGPEVQLYWRDGGGGAADMGYVAFASTSA